MAPFHIIALGSSFAAGAGIPPYVTRTAFRSENNYANILATRLGARLTDLSVSGAKLANLIDEPQVLLGRRFEPQVLGIPADADIVTITAGGNDLSYIGSMFGDSVRAYLIGRLFMPSAPQIAPMDANALTERFITLIDKIQEQAPHTHIFLVEYLTLLGPHTRAGIDVVFDESRIQYHQKVKDVLNIAYRRAGEARPQVTVVPMAERSLNHALGSEQPWVDPLSIYSILRGKPCLHPNLEGMQAVADVLYERLKNYEPTD